jgi:hypothetical protein
MVLAPRFKPLTATIIAFPGTPTKNTDPDTAILLKRAWQATERLICALPSTAHPEQVEHTAELNPLIALLEQVAAAAEHTFRGTHRLAPTTPVCSHDSARPRVP